MNLPRSTYYYRPAAKAEGLTDADLTAIIEDIQDEHRFSCLPSEEGPCLTVRISQGTGEYLSAKAALEGWLGTPPLAADGRRARTHTIVV